MLTILAPKASVSAAIRPGSIPGGTRSARAERRVQESMNTMRMNVLRILIGLALGVAVLCAAVPATAQVSATATPPPKDGFLGAIVQSLTGDVYSDPQRWRELSLSGLFTEGWDEAWVSPPAGEGGAPRQGWLNAFDGVFYRLGIATYGYAHNFVDNGNQNSGLLQFYLPFNRRFEFRVDIPAAVSNRGATGKDYETNFGDFTLVPRVILSETQNVTQSFNVAFRMPTGDTSNLNGVSAITPTYEFWTNWWKGLVLRGGAGFFVPFGHQSVDEVGARASFVANFAFGYYFTPTTSRRSAISCSISRRTSSRRSTTTISAPRPRSVSPRASGPTWAELVFPRRRRGTR